MPKIYTASENSEFHLRPPSPIRWDRAGWEGAWIPEPRSADSLVRLSKSGVSRGQGCPRFRIGDACFRGAHGYLAGMKFLASIVVYLILAAILGRGIGFLDGEQHEQAVLDGAFDFAGDGDAGAGDALDDGAHDRSVLAARRAGWQCCYAFWGGCPTFGSSGAAYSRS